MLKSILYKEWLKIQKISLLSLIVGLTFVIGVYLTVRHDLMMGDAEIFWNNLVNQEQIYYSVLQYLPLLIGGLIGVAQFVPEIIDKRIKLTLHLPLNEETVVLKMVWFGLAVTGGLFTILFLLFYSLGLYYFPPEIINMGALTVSPWFLAGLAAYLIAAFIILEPLWLYRIFYMMFGAVFLTLFFKSSLAGAYAPILVTLTVLVGLCSISTLFSIYRFRKGEM